MSEAQLPTGWEEVQLGNISEIIMGQSPPSETYNLEGQGLPFLQGKAEFNEVYPSVKKYCTKPLKVAKKRSVLISVRAPVGDVNIADRDYIIGRGLASISLKNKENDFLYFLLLKNKSRLANRSSGTTFQSINKTTLQTFPIPLPPLPEQRAIARALRSVQAAMEARRRELALERERKAALMEQLFTHGTRGEALKETDYGKVPESWQIKPLGQCAFVQTGAAKGRKLNGSDTVSVPYLRVANVQDGYIDLSEIKYIMIRESEIKRFRLLPDDVVVTEGGDFDKLGRGSVWKGDIPNCIHQNHIFAVRVNRDLLIPEYFAFQVQSKYGKAYFLRVAHKTTNLACINSSKLKAFPTLIPDYKEQEYMVSILKCADNKILKLENEIGTNEELFRAMLEELMTWRLSARALVEEFNGRFV